MPTRRKYRKKRYGKRRTKRARKKTFRPSLQMAVLPTPFPRRMFTKLVYNENIQENPAALSYGYRFLINSLYDINSTGAGSQPLFYDQLCSANGPYHRYRVRAVAFDITVSNLNTPVKCVCSIFNNSNPGTFTESVENQRSIGPRIINSMVNGGKIMTKFKGFVKIKDIVGENLSDDRDQATYNTSPNNAVYLRILADSLDGATNMTTINLDCKFTLMSEFFDLIPVAGS